LDLEPNSDELQIIESAARFLQDEWPPSRLHRSGSDRFTAERRASFAGLGWFGISLPEAIGGAGLSVIEEVLFYRELGRVLGPLGILAITLGGRICSQQRDDLVTPLLEGRTGVALCFPEDADLQAANGRFRAFNYEDAELAVVLTDSSAAVIEFQPRTLSELPSLDKSSPMAMVELSDATVVARAEPTALMAVARLCTAAMLVGLSEAVTTMIVEYAKIRQTFGRPIGAYQAVRHPCADMAVRADVARAQLLHAAVAVKEGHVDASLQADTAKYLANDTALANTDTNIQLHGGIGTTDEHDAHLFMKRAHVLNRWFGTNKLIGARVLKGAVLG
jgi:alkylation response protein AidB-like acyl-CoA dehydrogenase